MGIPRFLPKIHLSVNAYNLRSSVTGLPASSQKQFTSLDSTRALQPGLWGWKSEDEGALYQA